MQQNIYAAESADIKHFVSGEKKKNDHYLHAVIHFEGLIDENMLAQAIQATLPRLPLLKCRYVEDEEKAYWEDAGWNGQDMVFVVEAGGDVEETIQKNLTIKLDEKLGPQLRIAIVRDNHQDSLAIILNHMICDGGGFKDYLYLLSSYYTRLSEGKPIAETLITDPHARSIHQVFDAMNVEQLDQIKHAKLTSYKQSEIDHLPLTGDENNPFIITHEVEASQFEYIKSYAKSKGATVNDALFAAYVCALSEVVSANPIVLDCPVNLRAYLPTDSQPGFCNLTSNITCVVPSHVGERYDEALKSVKEVMEVEKKSLEPLRVYWDLEEAYQTHTLSEAKKFFPTIYSIPVNGMTNIGVIDEHKLSFSGLVIRDVFLSGSIKYAPYFQFAVTTFRKKMTFCTNFHGTKEDYLFLDGFVEQIIGKLPHA